jgi:phosphoribosyl 1,2-cyclic phosphate phosphodiesterase
MNLEITILGCGNSAGVPAIGNHWGVCDPAEPKNRRSRASVLVRSAKTTLVIDTGPDFREQINRTDVKMVDAVVYTHAHGDHTMGIDDLRVLRLRHKRLVDIYGARDAIDEIRKRFDYMFVDSAPVYPQVLVPHIIEPAQFGRILTIGDIDLVPFEQDHGTCLSLGFRFGNVAYSTDLVGLSEESLDALRGVEIWIADAAAYKVDKNIVHMTLKELIALNENHVKAKKVYVTHMPPSMDYRTLLEELPPGYEPAYDGLRLEAVT